MFTGDIRLVPAEGEDSLTPAGDRPAGRGIGVVDMARAIRGVDGAGRHRAAGDLALHVLDVMFATAQSIDTGSFVEISSGFEPVASLPDGWDPTQRTV